MTPELFAELGRQIGEITKEHVARAFSELDARLARFIVKFTDLENRIATIKDGVDGIAGEQGIQGAQGPQGELGPQGPQGIPGRDGLPGVPGQTGEKGIDGRNGKDGLDGIGIDDLEPEYDEHGRLSIKFVRAGVVVKSFRVPGMVYRELWTPNESYLRGDTVTWGASMWTALQDNDGSVKPDDTQKDGSRVWKLSVMRGRQGTAGTKGADGANGLNGKDGRDGRDWGRG